MSDAAPNNSSLESTLFQLLHTESARNMDQGNLLVMMSLVNLMGLIDIINRRMGGQGLEGPGVPEGALNSGGGSVPAGGKGAPPLNPSALMGILNQFMGAQAQGKPVQQGPGEEPAPGQMKPEPGPDRE